jgi:hypothetical protein
VACAGFPELGRCKPAETTRNTTTRNTVALFERAAFRKDGVVFVVL